MPNEDPGSIILYYNMARNVSFFAFDCKWIDEPRRNLKRNLDNKLMEVNYMMTWNGSIEIADILLKEI